LRANDFLGAAAEHFEAAGDDANAAEFHARAAEHAKSRFAHQAVLSHVQHALELLNRQLPERNGELLRWRLLEARERALHLQGDRARQLSDIEALEQLAEALDDDRRRARVASLRARRLDRMGDFFGAEAAARQAVAWATRAGDEEIRLHAQQMVGLAVAFQGNWMDAKALLESTLGEARAKGFRVIEDRCLTALGVIAESLDDPVATLELFQQTLDLARSAGDRWTEGIALGNLGWGWLGVGDLVKAGRDLEMGLQISKVVGDRTMESAWLCGLSLLALWQGADARALELAHTALGGAVAAKAREWETTALLRLGDAELALGRQDAAELAFVQAHAYAIEVGGGQQFVAAAGIALVALTRGDAEAALHAIAGPMAHWDSRSAVVSALDVRLIKLTCCRVLELAHDPRSADWLEQTYSELQSTAARIPDDRLRNCFLTNVPQNGEIVAAWQQAHRHSARRNGGAP
jgi:tetratricopeptide (TPR) repeat protein